LAEFDDRFGGTQAIFDWVQDLEMELANAAVDHPRYHAARARFCEEFLREFGEAAAGELIEENMRRAMAESVFAGGDPARSEALYREWLAADPQWGWIGWADNYFFAPRSGLKDLPRAEALLKEGLAVTHVRDRAHIADRLVSVYEDQGRQKEAEDLRRSEGSNSVAARHFASAPARRTKIDRNDPCPCGSGRKYKKSCGKA